LDTVHDTRGARPGADDGEATSRAAPTATTTPASGTARAAHATDSTRTGGSTGPPAELAGAGNSKGDAAANVDVIAREQRQAPTAKNVQGFAVVEIQVAGEAELSDVSGQYLGEELHAFERPAAAYAVDRQVAGINIRRTAGGRHGACEDAPGDPRD
jgi:hypothetical protein